MPITAMSNCPCISTDKQQHFLIFTLKDILSPQENKHNRTNFSEQFWLQRLSAVSTSSAISHKCSASVLRLADAVLCVSKNTNSRRRTVSMKSVSGVGIPLHFSHKGLSGRFIQASAFYCLCRTDGLPSRCIQSSEYGLKWVPLQLVTSPDG